MIAAAAEKRGGGGEEKIIRLEWIVRFHYFDEIKGGKEREPRGKKLDIIALSTEVFMEPPPPVLLETTAFHGRWCYNYYYDYGHCHLLF